MKHALTAVALAATLTVPAWAQNLAIVNGKPVPSSRMEGLAAQVERSGRPVDDALKAQIKEELIAREIYAQEAEKKGIKASKAYRQQVELAMQTLLIRELFSDFQQKNPVTDAEVKAEYDRFKAEYDKANAANGSQEFYARHILVATEDEAKAITEQLKKGGNFEEIAKKSSKDPGSGANGGLLDWAAPGNFVPEFGAAMAKLSKGQTTEAPVKTQYGWHIIRVDDVRAAPAPAPAPALEEIKPQISQQLMQQKVAKYQEGLRAKAKVQ
jgi:peptidyl-prolyl cis-trans isomerase C